MLEILKESGGVALAFTGRGDSSVIADWAKNEGFSFARGSGGDDGVRSFVKDRVFATGGPGGAVQYGRGLKYTDVTAEAAGIQRPS